MSDRHVIAIVMGDPAGIGPELIVKVLADVTVSERCRPFIIGDIGVMRANADLLGASLRFSTIDDLAEAQFQPGTLDVLNPPGFELGPPLPPAVHPKLGEAAGRYLALAYELAMGGRVDGVVMAPMNKESFRAAGYDYFDELQFLGELTGSEEALHPGRRRSEFGRSPSPSISPSKHIVGQLTIERVGRYIEHLHSCPAPARLCAAPRIACAALNPHAGEGGLFGCEEIDIIVPAIEQAQLSDIDVSGPVPADIVFKRALEGDFDGVVLHVSRSNEHRAQAPVPRRYRHALDGTARHRRHHRPRHRLRYRGQRHRRPRQPARRARLRHHARSLVAKQPHLILFGLASATRMSNVQPIATDIHPSPMLPEDRTGLI